MFKGVLLVTILSTFTAALVSGGLPYFPIEVSRTAAANPHSCRFHS